MRFKRYRGNVKWIIKITIKHVAILGLLLLNWLLVIVIIGIFMSIAVLSFVSIVERTKKEVCHTNSFTAGENYHTLNH
jgi:Tfp pilus assembly protein PilE